jgi:hypothetical protein
MRHTLVLTTPSPRLGRLLTGILLDFSVGSKTHLTQTGLVAGMRVSTHVSHLGILLDFSVGSKTHLTQTGLVAGMRVSTHVSQEVFCLNFYWERKST